MTEADISTSEKAFSIFYELMKPVYFGLMRTRRSVRKPGVTHCSVARQRTVSLQFGFCFLDSICLSHSATFSDVKIYKDVHGVHFVTCVHKQSVSFPFKIQGLSEREKNISADIMYTNVHKPPSVPVKNRCYMVRFFFLSVI